MFQLSPAQSPAERVLMLAEGLPATRDQLVAEAERTESMLANLQEPLSAEGRLLQERLVAVMEAHLEGIDGLLEFDETGDSEVLEWSLERLQQSAFELDALEDETSAASQDLRLVA